MSSNGNGDVEGTHPTAIDNLRENRREQEALRAAARAGQVKADTKKKG